MGIKMKRSGGGFWKKELNKKILAVGAAVLLLLILAPLLRIMEYAVPWYDDYTYGKFVKNFWVETHSVGGVLQGAFYCARSSWFAWQGTFSSIFLMALMPAVWGEDKYFLGPLLILLLLLTALFVLAGVLARDVLKCDRWTCLFLQCTVSAMSVVLMHTAQTGIFWYNAAVHYTAMHAFAILLAAVLVKLFLVESRAALGALTVCSVLLAVLAGGSNFVTALQGLLMTGTFFGMGLLLRRRRVWFCLPGLLAYAGAFFLNVSAPGNGVRQAQLAGMGMNPAEAVGHSFLAAFQYLWKFGGAATLVILAVLAPVLWRAVKDSAFSFRYPVLVSAYSLCLFAAGFTPSFYSLGHEGLGRTLNAAKLTYQLLIVLNEAYWLGWLSRRARRTEPEERPDGEWGEAYGDSYWRMRIRPFLLFQLFRRTWRKVRKNLQLRCYWWIYPIAAAALALIFILSPNQAGSYSSYGAFYYIRTGEAYNFHQQYLERVEILKSDAQDVVLEPYRFRPWLICAGDLSEDPTAEENRAVADWYGKRTVACAPKEQ